MPEENEPKKRVDFPRKLYENLFNMLFAISKDNNMDSRYKAISEQVIKLFADCSPTARGQVNSQPANRQTDSSRTDQQPVSGQPNQQTNQ